MQHMNPILGDISPMKNPLFNGSILIQVELWNWIRSRLPAPAGV
jgi:hypothetical protein